MSINNFMNFPGATNKTFEHLYATRGEVFGKTRFCQLEKEIEGRTDHATASLMISLDVHEVSHRAADSENTMLFHRDDTFVKEEYKVLTIPQANKNNTRPQQAHKTPISMK